jgi:hypothetical protein
MKSVLLDIAFLATVVSATGCSAIFGPDQTVVLHVSKLEAPPNVGANSAFGVGLTVETGGCVSFRRIQVDRDNTGATMTAYGRDASIGKNVLCPDFIQETLHVVQLNPPFSSPFTITVNRGRLSPLVASVLIQ